MTTMALADATLGELEAIIDRGKQTFAEVGNALTEIRERKLYREGYATFEDYCQRRHGFSASRGRQLIAAAGIVTAVTLSGGTPPTSEREARALAAAQRAYDAEAVDVLAEVVDAVRQFVQSTPDDDLDTARAKRALRALEMVMAASWEDAPALAALAQFASNTANLIAECRLRCMREVGKLVAEVERAAHSATEEPA